MVWEVTVVSTLADSYIATAARGRGEVAELPAARKRQIYSDIPSAYTFLSIAVQTFGSVNGSANHFFEDLGRKSGEVSVLILTTLINNAFRHTCVGWPNNHNFSD